MNHQESNKLERRVIQNLEKYISKGTSVIAAVSGGPDSIFLMHLLAKTGAKIVIAHVDHEIRKTSKKDTNLVIKLAKTLNVTTEILTKNVIELAKTLKKGLEETGRIVRYEFFEKLAKKHKATYIITAHHAGDNLETKLFNFTRGSSIQGLSGMAEVSQKLLRPLLDISKKEIIAYLDFNKIPYIVDETNTDTEYSRNFLRHEIIPRLEKLNPNLAKTTAQNTAHLRETVDFLDQEARSWISQNSKPKGLNAKTFRLLHPALQKHIIRQLYKDKLGSTKNLESVHIDEILKTINGPHGNKTKTIAGLTFYIKNNIIQLEK